MNYGEIAERDQFRVGYVNQESFDAYFELSSLSDLIAVLNTVVGLDFEQIAKGVALQARKVTDGLFTSIRIEPRLDTGEPPQIMSLKLEDLTDFLYALGLFQTALPSDPVPDDWSVPEVAPFRSGGAFDQRITELALDSSSEFSKATSAAQVEEAVDLILNTPLNNDRDNGQAGLVIPTTPIFSESTNTMTSGRIYAVRFVPSRSMTIRSIAFQVVTAATANTPIEVGVLSSSGAVIGSSGSVSSLLTTTGTKAAPVPDIELEAGQVYYGYALTTSEGNTAALRRYSVFASAFGTGLGVAESMGATGKTIPAASPVTGLTVNDAGPILALREFA